MSVQNLEQSKVGASAVKNDVVAKVLQQLDELLEEARKLSINGIRSVNEVDLHVFIANSMEAIYKIGGPASQYVKQAEENNKINTGWDNLKVGPLVGVLKTLRNDVEKGYLAT